MLEDLRRLLAATAAEAERADYARAIKDDNVLGKRTHATRVQSDQRLGELYALDPQVTVFRTLRAVWSTDAQSQPLLAILCALARDPLLRATADPLLPTQVGAEWPRLAVTASLRRATRERLRDEVLQKVVRNAASSWTQAGHLEGRVRKVRRRPQASAPAAAYAMLLGYLLGLRGRRLLESPWARVIDLSPFDLLGILGEAKRLGLVDLKHAGEVFELSFPGLLTEEEKEASRGSD